MVKSCFGIRFWSLWGSGMGLNGANSTISNYIKRYRNRRQNYTYFEEHKNMKSTNRCTHLYTNTLNISRDLSFVSSYTQGPVFFFNNKSYFFLSSIFLLSLLLSKSIYNWDDKKIVTRNKKVRSFTRAWIKKTFSSVSSTASPSTIICHCEERPPILQSNWFGLC